MAKMKTFQVEVEITRRIYVHVEARKAGGAEQLIQTEEGWTEATRYEDDLPMRWDPKTMRIIGSRES